ncbi:transcription antitermination factor NusB [Candidatus Peregrinibacteria bacterium CG10_big_fil_rev_8_21_14_0_10_42_8]|nr:MAG: transcription antitermination factor NusB [Candidatus Peregrinibacteria bacterium CG10_big_fil_rev_8_21_14_0_10_42_8]
MARKRHLSRIAVMQVLFERGYREIDDKKSLRKNIEELGNVDEEFAQTLLEGSLSMEDELKKEIELKAPEWSFDRMDPIARPVLIMGAFELLYANDAPPAVVMNECIEIAKEYGTDETGKFVNGVLNALAKGL